MNRRELLASSLLGVTCLAAPSWPTAASTRQLQPLRHYLLETSLWLHENDDWVSEPILRIVAGDGTSPWSWCVNRYRADEETHCEVNRDVPYEDCFGPFGPIEARRWYPFRWRLYFSDDEDGLIEGWFGARKAMAVRGPNIAADFVELSLERSKNRAVHLSRVRFQGER